MSQLAVAPVWDLPPTPAPLTQLRYALDADAAKLRRTLALLLALGGGALPVALNFCIFYFKGQYLVKPGQNAWQAWVINSWQTAAALLLPLFIVLLVSLVSNLENRAGGWKHLLAQPLSYGAVFASKVLVLLGLNLLAHMVYGTLLVLAGLLLTWLRPDLNFSQYPINLGAVLGLLGHTFLATLGMLGIQLAASLLWRSVVAPLALGLAGVISAITLLRWEHAATLPYTAPYKVASLLHGENQLLLRPGFVAAEGYALLWLGLSLGVGYWALRRQ